MNKDFRLTKQKQLVYQEVINRFDHPTAEEVYLSVHKQYPSISKSTVYRNLDVLAKEGLIRRIKVSGSDRFDLTLAHHSHLLCVRCRKLIDCDIPYNESLDNEVEMSSGFKISQHNLIFEGICPDCLKKEETK